jgi:UDP-glucuronate 4-epimerase
MVILVTGAAGFIGYHLCRRLIARGDEVVGIDSLNHYYDPELKYARLAELGIRRDEADSGELTSSSFQRSFRFQRLALEERDGMERLFLAAGSDRVCHLAAQAGVRYSLENPRAYLESNVMGFFNVLEGCRAARTRHLVYASSSSVYGIARRLPFSVHDAATHPASIYAATKRTDELMAHAYSHLYGLPATGLRFFTVYGPWGRPDMAYFAFAEAICDARPIDLYKGGEVLRDFTFIDDVIECVMRVLDRPAAPDPAWDPARPSPASSTAQHRIFNIGNSRAESVSALVSALEECLGARAVTRTLPMQPGDVAATEADVSELERDFGWRPSTPLKTGIALFIDWFKAWRGIREGRK